MESKIIIELTIEKSSDAIWGYFTYKDSFIIDHADDISALIVQLARLLSEFEGIDVTAIEFNITETKQ